jgi:hypothetical protein
MNKNAEEKSQNQQEKKFPQYDGMKISIQVKVFHFALPYCGSWHKMYKSFSVVRRIE